MGTYTTCKICGSNKVAPLRSFIRNGCYKLIFRCPICNFCFDVEDNKIAPREGYFDKYTVDERPRLMRHEEADWLVDNCDLSDATYMEIGPGLGQFMERLKERVPSLKLNAVEIAPEAANACRNHGAAVIEGDWENLSYATLLPYHEACDIVASIHCIEHMAEPLQGLRKMAWLVKPNGALYIHTPNHDHARDENWFHYHDEHIALFGESSLRLAFDMVNLSVIAVRKLYGDDLIVIGRKRG